MSELTKCQVCRGLIDEEDLFCANCGTEAPLREVDGELPARGQDKSGMPTHSFECGGCGASMSYDASARTLRCPFCGSERLEKRADERTLAPNRVIPFRVGREAALATMRKWLGRGFFRPSDLSERAAVDKMAAVYVPYWIFQARTHTYWTADTNELPASARGDWRPLFGEHRGEHAGVLVGASGALSSHETHALCPFDLAQGVEPDQVDLENATFEKFKVGRKYARPLARQGLEEIEAETCEATYVPGRARNCKVNSLVEGLASEPVLLPVWIMAYRYNERFFRFLVNGQTGTATGEAPTSWKKILAVTVLAVGVLLLLLAIIGLFAS
jgi:DNA-directed RNA polymerase subunit RPC12/RpoP